MNEALPHLSVGAKRNDNWTAIKRRTEWNDKTGERFDVVEATVRFNNLGQGEMTNASSRAYIASDKLASDEAGHVITRRLGGPNVPENLMPQNANLNRGDYKKHETDIYNWMVEDDRRHVNISVKLHYRLDIDKGTRPWLIVYRTEYFERGHFVDYKLEKFPNVHKKEGDAIFALCELRRS